MKWLILTVLGAGTLFLTGTMGKASSPRTSEIPFRFVDINEVLQNFDVAKKDREQVKNDYLAQLAAMNSRREDLQKKSRELDPLDPSSDEYFQTKTKLEIELLKLERERDWLAKQRDTQHLKNLHKAYDLIRTSVGRYAQANSLLAVFEVNKNPEDTPETGPEDLMEKQRRIQNRKVLYFDPSLDVTQQIIKILNAQ